MSNKELQKKLLDNIGAELSVFGFGEKAKQQSFYRPFEGGWVCVHLAFLDHKDDFDVTIDVAVRFNEVEDLVNAKSDLLSKTEKASTSTLGVELGNLSSGQQKRWAVSSEGGIPSVVGSIVKVYREFGEPYLEEYSSMGSAYKVLASDDRDIWMHCPFHAARAKRAVAIAKILNKPDIEGQISKRKDFLEGIDDFGLVDFSSFADSVL